MGACLIRRYEAQDKTQVEEIFWETSGRTEFASAEERRLFQHQYLDDYLSQVVWVAVEGTSVLGYILAQLDTLATESSWAAHLHLFRDHYQQYPAHLHINCHSAAQGKGLGGKLLVALEQELSSQGVKGLHLITSATARNVGFYKKYGYLEISRQPWKATELLLLGKIL